ncbi:MAG: Fic family protein [Ostreibacterium sp.]
MSNIGKKEALFIARKMKPELIHNMAVAEGTSLTFIDTKTLLVDRITPQSKSIEDVEQILHLGRAWDEMLFQVKADTFEVTKDNFIKINEIVARDEALEVGAFRHAQVYIGDYTPPPSSGLNNCFNEMLYHFNGKSNVEEKASDLFLDSARNQYFFDGNKRTAQIIMNGFLIINGHNPRSIQKDDLSSYNIKMAKFYQTNNKEEMYDFLGKSQAQLDLKFNLVELVKAKDRDLNLNQRKAIINHYTHDLSKQGLDQEQQKMLVNKITERVNRLGTSQLDGAYKKIQQQKIIDKTSGQEPEQ